MKKRLQVFSVLTFFLLATVILIPGGTVSAEGETIVSISGPEKVNPGEQFTIGIEVETNDPIAGMQFNLSFDPSLLTADSIVEGNLLSQGGASTYFSPGTIDNITGSISAVFGVITIPDQTISASGTFATITFTASMSGGTSLLTLSNVLAGDSEAQPIQIEVVNGQVPVNRAPSLDSINNRTTNLGETLTFVISATDADGDQLVYSASGLPEGASFNPDTETFSWTPRYDQAGIYSVRFEVSDGQLIDFEEITITVAQVHEDWDINGDEAANVLDMILITQRWGETGLTGWIREDTNKDGAINVLDTIIIGQNWTG